MQEQDNKNIIRILLNIFIPLLEVVLVCTLGVWLLGFFAPFVIGWCIALIANPLVKFLERKIRLVRKRSSVIIVVFVLAVVIGVLTLAGYGIVLWVQDLYANLPEIYESIRATVNQALAGMSGFYERLPSDIQNYLISVRDNLDVTINGLISQMAYPTVSMAGSMARGIPTALVYSIMTILSSYFFIVEHDRIMNWVHEIMPEKMSEYFRFLRDEIGNVFSKYILGRLRIMVVVAFILLVGFRFLKVNHFILLAVLIALFDFLPVVGTGTILIPWAVISLLSGRWPFAIALIVIYLITSAVRMLIEPKIMGDTMGLSPLLTLVFLFIGFKISGIFGMIISVPLGMLLLNMYRYGMFDSFKDNVKLLFKEIDRIRKEG